MATGRALLEIQPSGICPDWLPGTAKIPMTNSSGASPPPACTYGIKAEGDQKEGRSSTAARIRVRRSRSPPKQRNGVTIAQFPWSKP